MSKIPVTTSEVLASSLMGMFEKRRFRNFLLYMADYDKSVPSTFKVRTSSPHESLPPKQYQLQLQQHHGDHLPTTPPNPATPHRVPP